MNNIVANYSAVTLVYGLTLTMLMWVVTFNKRIGIGFDIAKLFISAFLTAGHLSESLTIVRWLDVINMRSDGSMSAIYSIFLVFLTYTSLFFIGCFLMRVCDLNLLKHQRKAFK